MIRTEIAIIGAGPGGYVAALRAAQLGAKVVCIEREHVGGVCLNRGCVPTKALLRCAEVWRLVHGARRFGISVEGASFDWGQIQRRKDQVVTRLRQGVQTLLKRAGVEVIKGQARFARANMLLVEVGQDTESVEAQKIIVATGSRPLQVPIPGLDGEGILDSRKALELEALPEHICIIGSGAIGIEFASLLAAFGVRVTLVEMLPRILPLMDLEIGEALSRSLSRQGIRVMTNARVTRIEEVTQGYVIVVETPEGESRIEAQEVLSAIGRAPNVESLDLHVIGLGYSRKGIAVDNRMRTVVPNVYAIGDVAAEGPMLAHVASHQGIVAAEDALGYPAHMDYRSVPNCVFSMPEVASVGLSEQEARDRGYDVRIGKFPFVANGKAVAYGETDGFVKVVAEANHGAVLGVHIVGPHASDLILEGALGLELEVTLDEIGHTIHAHPTLGEAIAEAALDAAGRVLHLPKS